LNLAGRSFHWADSKLSGGNLDPDFSPPSRAESLSLHTGSCLPDSQLRARALASMGLEIRDHIPKSSLRSGSVSNQRVPFVRCAVLLSTFSVPAAGDRLGSDTNGHFEASTPAKVWRGNFQAPIENKMD